MSGIIVIGGINMDICGKANSDIIMKDSNIGKITLSFGGVGRNIAENLARMGESVSFITAYGDDMFGREIMDNLCELGIDTSCCVKLPYPTSSYMFVAANDGDMTVAVNDMDIYESLTIDKIEPFADKINSSELIVLDTNLRKDLIEYILKNFKPPKIVDPVSTVKAYKIKDVLQYIDVLKPNRMEAEYLSGVVGDEYLLAEKLLEKGVSRVFETLGDKGSVAYGATVSKRIPKAKVTAVNATGAGDAYTAGLAREFLRSGNTVKMAISGTCASSIAVESIKTVSEKMSKELLEKRMEEFEI